VFVYGGISADIGVDARIRAFESGSDTPYLTETDIYGNEEIGFHSKRFNASYDIGGGIRIKGIQLNLGISKGIINHTKMEGVSLKQNKNLCVTLSWMFP